MVDAAFTLSTKTKWSLSEIMMSTMWFCCMRRCRSFCSGDVDRCFAGCDPPVGDSPAPSDRCPSATRAAHAQAKANIFIFVVCLLPYIRRWFPPPGPRGPGEDFTSTIRNVTT